MNYGLGPNPVPHVTESTLTIPEEMEGFSEVLDIFARDPNCSVVVTRLCAAVQTIGLLNAFFQIPEEDVDVLRDAANRMAGKRKLILYKFICSIWVDGIPLLEDYQEVQRLLETAGNREEIIEWLNIMLIVFPNNPTIPLVIAIIFFRLNVPLGRVREVLFHGLEVCRQHLTEMETSSQDYQESIFIHRELRRRYIRQLRRINRFQRLRQVPARWIGWRPPYLI
jgi:hypothetical protein